VNKHCPFCEVIEGDRAALRTTGAAAFPDAFPVSPGHTLVVPTRHVADFFDLDADEQADVWRLVAEVRSRLAAEHAPDGFNVGLNAGAAAGQTVSHAHVHVIPRYRGDVADPRGGVRWLIAERAAWWAVT
jgi:diadenosine tetraphosphate (Ap4A) HIT family hydrolase